MSSIDLKHVARLSRLHLSEEELKFFATQVSQILSFVEKLDEVKGLESVPPTSHPFSFSDVFRKDEPAASLFIEEFLKRSPRAKGRFFQVPKIIEDKS